MPVTRMPACRTYPSWTGLVQKTNNQIPMKNLKTIYGIIVAVICLAVVGVDAQSPKGRSGTFALTNATIETITNGVITNGTVVITGGKITAVGTNVQVPQGAETI